MRLGCACGFRLVAHIAPEKWGHDDYGRPDTQTLVRNRFRTRPRVDKGQLSWSEALLHISQDELRQPIKLCTDAGILPTSDLSSKGTNPLRAVDADARAEADSGVRRRSCGVETLNTHMVARQKLSFHTAVFVTEATCAEAETNHCVRSINTSTKSYSPLLVHLSPHSCVRLGSDVCVSRNYPTAFAQRTQRRNQAVYLWLVCL